MKRVRNLIAHLAVLVFAAVCLGGCRTSSQDYGQRAVLEYLPKSVQANAQFLVSAHYSFDVGTARWTAPNPARGRDPNEYFKLGIHRVACFFVRSTEWEGDRCYCAQWSDVDGHKEGLVGFPTVMTCPQAAAFVHERYMDRVSALVSPKCGYIVRRRVVAPSALTDGGLMSLKIRASEYHLYKKTTPDNFDPLQLFKDSALKERIKRCPKEP